jgi:predicted Zn-dependent protease
MITTVCTRYLLALALLTTMFTACTSVAHTERRQLSFVSDAELAAAADRNFENFMRANSHRVVLASEAPEVVVVVERVSDRVIAASGIRGKRDWETIVVKSREANAFVLPNGKIVVFTGLLPIVKDENGLAAVLGHEVAHVLARHSAERMSHQIAAQSTLKMVNAAGGIFGASTPKLKPYLPSINAALGLSAQYGAILPYSRTHESEADRIGLTLAAKAGYDPEAAVGVWERMQERNGNGPWEFLSTHPSPSTRIVQIRSYLPEAKAHFRNPS